MRQYQDLVRNVLQGGTFKANRTGVDTISSFSHHYVVDLNNGFPLLTTKKLDGFRWNSLIHEFLWYLSGEEHIRSLSEKTGIWDAWADEEGHLDTAYGRFWRRYPIPSESDQLPGEVWSESGDRWVSTGEDGRKTFDQLQYILDTLREEPHSRRMVVSAWHPANAAISTLPPCHYTFVFTVHDNQLNVHLTQRSGDIALGVPFNLAAYALLTHVIANKTGFSVGKFGHTIVDAHIYCGLGERGKWYKNNISTLQDHISKVQEPEGFSTINEWIESTAPPEPPEEKHYDHVPGLLTQLTREPKSLPDIDINGTDKPLHELDFDDIQLNDYNPEPGISFAVAE